MNMNNLHSLQHDSWLYLESKQGHVKLPQTSVINIIEKMVISYVDSSEVISIIADAQLSQGLCYESFRNLLKLTVITPFIQSTEYIQLFTRKMKLAKLTTDDADRAVDRLFQFDGR